MGRQVQQRSGRTTSAAKRVSLTAIFVAASGTSAVVPAAPPASAAKLKTNPFFEREADSAATPPGPQSPGLNRPSRLPAVSPANGGPAEPAAADDPPASPPNKAEPAPPQVFDGSRPAKPASRGTPVTGEKPIDPVATLFRQLSAGAAKDAETEYRRPPADRQAVASRRQPSSERLELSLSDGRSEPAGVVTQPAASEKAFPRQSWLPSGTAASSRRMARQWLDQAAREYGLAAWASAEASAWEALRISAESVDQAASTESTAPTAAKVKRAAAPGAETSLERARTAIREAEDFAGLAGEAAESSLGRLIRSHRTDVIREGSAASVTATEAIDRYLDHARIQLSGLASRSLEAAEAMDLLAAIQLQRSDASPIASPVALCLRRAALQGQPGNASLAARLGQHLAHVGLTDEARWALEHSLAIEPSRDAAGALVRLHEATGRQDEAARLRQTVRRRWPAGESSNGAIPAEVVQLSPREFAAVSRPVNDRETAASRDDAASNRGRATGGSPAVAASPAVRLYSHPPRVARRAAGEHRSGRRQPPPHSAKVDSVRPDKKKSPLRRLTDSIRRFW